MLHPSRNARQGGALWPGLLQAVLGRPRTVIALHLLLALAMLPGMLRLGMDNSPEVFFPRDDKLLRDYRQFSRDFRAGPSLRLLVSGPGVWTRAGLAWIGNLEEGIAVLPGVSACLGLASLQRWQSLEFPPRDPRRFRARILDDPRGLFRGWISPDGEFVSILVTLAEAPSGKRHDTLERIRRLAATAPAGLRIDLTGIPVLQRALDRALLRMAAVLLPALALIALALLWAVFRSPALVLIPLLFVAMNQFLLFGLMGYAGIRLNLINIILAPLLFVVSLAGLLHILAGFQGKRSLGMDRRESVLETYRERGEALFWTGITTLAGFGSMAFTSLPVLRSMGAWAALGIASMMILDFLLYPALLAALPAATVRAPEAGGSFRARAQRLGRSLALASIRLRKRVGFVSLAAVALLLPGILLLQAEDSIAGYFPAGHPVRDSLSRSERAGLGGDTLELVLSHPGSVGEGDAEPAGFYSPSAQRKLFQISRGLRDQKVVAGAFSSGDMLEAALAALLVEGEATESVRWLALGLLQTSPASRELLRTLVGPGGRSARVRLLVPFASYRQLRPTIDRVTRQARALFPGADIRVTGHLPLLLKAQHSLFRNLVQAFSLTLACVFAVFLLHLRSLRLTLLLLLPNLWPIAAVLGGMGWLRIPLDNASIMTTAIVLGLAVDNTLHTANRYRLLSRTTQGTARIVAALEKLAPAHILTALILACGFAACSLSELVPVARFGALSALAIAAALAGDLVMVPALLTCDRNQAEEKRHDPQRA